ncbi:putative secreted protein [Listeria marthii FSL S4-120]|uniref:Secreted protein n=1 Tax=Listeria marthii FSL S4-120 TaxID=702457 RepID=A0ABP2K7C1_9LIST|nr:putative secreted protein [Listeria marthii FSL S4-120]
MMFSSLIKLPHLKYRNFTPEMTVQDYDFEWGITSSKMKE